MQRQALIIEDDQDIAALVAMHLSDIDCRSRIVNNGTDGVEAYKNGSYDLVVLDLMLPGLDGLSVCRQIRACPGYVPILMLTAKSSEFDRVLGLEVGADDYLAKPFSIRELQARVKALFRRVDAISENARAAPSKEKVIEQGDLTIDPKRRHVSLAGQQVDLTAKEFDLLYYFATHPGLVFSRPQLLDQVWGYNHDGYEHTVNTHINRLRAKIEEDPSSPKYIQTVWGIGYKFAD